ncbi:DEKNAAC100322 [Brettanomyces naardenensis]|uniref:DEKNAAC100322 n=1 Tax=Brettanomyces naardenensis TaxID=13370 RepID=A0A448YF88_BRENA|nr:DEKNAAC100322 [Brettanomyces naardenensis]
MTGQETTKRICVFCGSSFGRGANFAEKATELGVILAKNDYGLVYGGGTTGLMGCVAKAVASNGSYVHGIIPDALVSKERKNLDEIEKMNHDLKESVSNHKGATPLNDSYGKTTIVPDMHTRKRMMAQEADGFVAMPGGFGTLEEVMEITTWSQLGIHAKPIVLFNIDHYYDEFILFLENCVKRGFISPENGNIIAVATTPEEVIERLKTYKVPEGRFNLTWRNQ